MTAFVGWTVSAVCLAVGLLFAWLWIRIRDLQSELALRRARAELQDLRGRRDELVAKADAMTPELERLTTQIDEARRDLGAPRSEAEMLAPKDLIARFKTLGYTLALLLALPVLGHAQDSPPGPDATIEVRVATLAAIEHELTTRRTLEARLDAKIRAQAEQLELLQRAVGLGTAGLEQAERALSLALERAEWAEAAVDAWYHSTWLLPLGLALGAAAGFVLALTVSS